MKPEMTSRFKYLQRVPAFLSRGSLSNLVALLRMNLFLRIGSCGRRLDQPFQGPPTVSSPRRPSWPLRNRDSRRQHPHVAAPPGPAEQPDNREPRAPIPVNWDSSDRRYTDRLVAMQSVWWKRMLFVQAPYRWNVRHLNPGFTLDIGCGLGRNLVNLGGHGVGIDHNSDFVDLARSRGLNAFTPAEFERSSFNVSDSFDSILLAHVAEHMTEQQALKLLSDYLYLLKPHGQVIFITPQESGYRSDPTHIQFMDFEALRRIASEAGLTPVKEYFFPFSRILGRLFKYNEFVSISKKTAASSEDL